MISATNIHVYLQMYNRESKCYRVLTVGELGEDTQLTSTFISEFRGEKKKFLNVDIEF